MTDAITREEKLMKAIATGSPSNIKPITREEIFLAKAGGQDVETPEPITRREKLLQSIIDNGVGGGEGVPVEEYNKVKNALDGMIICDITEIEGDCETVGDYAFSNRKSLTSADFPLVTTIGEYAFQYCNKLADAIIPMVTTIKRFAFLHCDVLETADFPLVTTLGQNAFEYCSALTTVDFSLVKIVEMSTFSNCKNLVNANLPKVTRIKNNGFTRCEKIEYINIPLVEDIYTSGFSYCYKLDTLVLRSQTIVSLMNVNAFNNTPFTGYNGLTGTFYVPQALVEEYKTTATNWSALYAQGYCDFLPIEGSEYE